MNERMDETTPLPIQSWLLSPYTFFSKKYGRKDKSLLDAACGNNIQKAITEMYFGEVFTLDNANPDATYNEDIMWCEGFIPNSFDYTFCLETIEHLPQKDHKMLIDIMHSITRGPVVFGSVNLDGPKEVDGVEIWTGKKNPYHLKEYGFDEWKDLFLSMFPREKVSFYGQYFDKNNDQFLFLKHWNFGISNYAVVHK